MTKRVFGMSACIGESLTGLPYPIFFDPHYAIKINRGPVTLVTGEPGSGKTFFSLLLAAYSSSFGKLTFIIDPKGDFIALKKLERGRHLEDIRIWSVFSDIDKKEVDINNVGMLDPLLLTDDVNDNVALALEVIETLAKSITPTQSTALIPILKDVASGPNPSLKKVVNLLKRSRNDDIRSLGFDLEVSLDTSIAKIIVAPTKGEVNRLSLHSGTIVASLMGLSFPNVNKSQDKYSVSEKLSICVMRMLTHLVLEAMRKVPKTILKTLIIDEAWSVFANPIGKDMIDEVSRLGRSLNMATILVTQSPKHVEEKSGEASLDTTISTRFAFRNTSKSDNKANASLMGLPKAESNENIFAALGQGQCLMQDCQQQLSFVEIMATDPSWIDILSTTPKPKSSDTVQ